MEMSERLQEHERRLDSIAFTLEELARHNEEALCAFKETDERYRKELDEYAADRVLRRTSLAVATALRVVAVALLTYIAVKLQ